MKFSIKDFFSKCDQIAVVLDANSSKYENIFLLRDFNSSMLDSSGKWFCEIYILRSLVKEATCFKNPENPLCINLILIGKHLCEGVH